MTRSPVIESVVTRLVACLLLGGFVISVGLGIMSYGRNAVVLQMELTQDVRMSARNMQGLLREMILSGAGDELDEILSAFTNQAPICAARVTGQGIEDQAIGDWDGELAEQAAIWPLSEQVMSQGSEVDLSRYTLVRAPFLVDGRMILLELLVDGPGARRTLRARIFHDLTGSLLFVSVLTLFGLLLLRRWVTGPLSQVVEKITDKDHVSPEAFFRLADKRRGEFSQLAQEIGQMLSRLDRTTSELRRRERAFENLYQFAPAAMVSLDPAGRIIEANRRAAELLQVEHEKALLDSTVLDWVMPEDRPLLRQTLDRLDLDNLSRCELRLNLQAGPVDVLVESTGVRDELGNMQSVRLSMLDVTPIKQLHRELADKSQLLNLVIDHMSDAILLVDAKGRIAANNQQLASFLHCRPDALIGQRYEPESFWDELGILNHELFTHRLQQIEADRKRPAQERFETRVGTFLFQGIPVDDDAGEPVGRLWVVQEITPQEQSHRLLAQQTHQLQSVKQLSAALADVDNPMDLLDRACSTLFTVMGVEAVGIALRRDLNGTRSQQRLHRGYSPYLLEPNRALIQVVEQDLMPQVLLNEDVTFWPDLPMHMPWARQFEHAGLTCVAGGPLRGSIDPVGVIWVARRGGERLEQQHIHMLEAVAPVIAARVEFAQMRQAMQELDTTDTVTDLPNERHYLTMAHKLENRPGYHWSTIHVHVDNFRKLNEIIEHEAANRLLWQVGVALRRYSRRSTFIARLHGANFAVLCPGVDLQGAAQHADRIRHVVSTIAVPMPEGENWRLTTSIGVAASPDDGLASERIIDLAGDRVALAKRSGRDRVVSTGVDAQRHTA